MPDQDTIHRLHRAEQTAIFRLRTGHCGPQIRYITDGAFVLRDVKNHVPAGTEPSPFFFTGLMLVKLNKYN